MLVSQIVLILERKLAIEIVWKIIFYWLEIENHPINTQISFIHKICSKAYYYYCPQLYLWLQGYTINHKYHYIQLMKYIIESNQKLRYHIAHDYYHKLKSKLIFEVEDFDLIYYLDIKFKISYPHG